MRQLQHAIAKSLHWVMGTPEWNLAIFALLLNFPWEVMQAPLFAGMASAPYTDVIRGCSQATVGDMVILLLAYALVALLARNRRWVLAPSSRQLALFIAIGVCITAVIEWLATHGLWIGSWTYSPAMPVVPGVGIGLSPLLQWLVLPLLVVWFVRRQLAERGNQPGSAS